MNDEIFKIRLDRIARWSVIILILLLCWVTSHAQIKAIATIVSNHSGGETPPAETPFVITDNAIKGDQGYQHNYVGSWTDGPPQGVEGWYQGTLSYSNTTNDYVEFKFNGTLIEWYTEIKSTHGIAAVSIDGGSETDVDLYSATATLQVLKFTSGTLSQDVHTIKVRVKGTKNGSSSGYYVITDYFKVFNNEDVPETPDPEPYDRFWGIGGTDSGDCGSLGTQCATLYYTLTQTSAGEKVKGGAGTFTETHYLAVPLGISIWGAGKGVTIIKLNSSLNYTAATDVSKAMFQYSIGTGNQTLKDLSIEGNAKQVNGGIYVNRTNVDFDNIEISNFDRFGFYAKGSGIDFTNSEIINSSFSNSSFSMGAILIAAVTDFHCDNVDINEGEGYAVKAWETQPILQGFEFKNGNVTVPPGSACCGNVNIAFELHDCYPRDCVFENNIIEGNLSLVKPQDFADDGEFSIRIDNNTFDLKTRANTNTTAIELTLHNVIIRNNYFRSAKHGFITNFDGNLPSRNWVIDHNIFYAENLVQTNPTGAIRSKSGFYNMDVFNNTFHIPPGSNQTFAILFQGSSGGGKTSTDVQFKNNIIYDQSTADGAAGANHMVRIEGSGGSYTGSSTISYNQIFGMPTGSQTGITYSNNLTTDPELIGSGINATPLVFDPFYRPDTGSPVIESGIDVSLPFTGSAPTRGRYEID